MRHDFNTMHLLHSIREIPSSSLNSSEKYILIMILSCMNNSNDTWYSQDSIASFCAMSERRVRGYIHSLVEKGFIFIEKPTVYGRSKTNHYHLNIDLIMTHYIGRKGDDMSPLNERKGDKTSEKGGQNVRSKGDKTSGKDRNRRKKEEGELPASREAVVLPSQKPLEPGVPMPTHVKEKLDKLFNRVNVH